MLNLVNLVLKKHENLNQKDKNNNKHSRESGPLFS